MNGINGNWGNCQWSKSHKLDLRGKKCHNSTCEDLGTHLCCRIWLLSEYSSSYWFQKGRKMKACLWQRRDGNLLHLRDKGMDWLIHILVCLTKCFTWTMPTLKRGRKNPAEFIWVIYLSHLSKCGWLFFSPMGSTSRWASFTCWLESPLPRHNWSKPQLCSNIFNRHDCLQSKHLPTTLL